MKVLAVLVVVVMAGVLGVSSQNANDEEGTRRYLFTRYRTKIVTSRTGSTSYDTCIIPNSDGPLCSISDRGARSLPIIPMTTTSLSHSPTPIIHAMLTPDKVVLQQNDRFSDPITATPTNPLPTPQVHPVRSTNETAETNPSLGHSVRSAKEISSLREHQTKPANEKISDTNHLVNDPSLSPFSSSHQIYSSFSTPEKEDVTDPYNPSMVTKVSAQERAERGLLISLELLTQLTRTSYQTLTTTTVTHPSITVTVGGCSLPSTHTYKICPTVDEDEPQQKEESEEEEDSEEESEESEEEESEESEEEESEESEEEESEESEEEESEESEESEEEESEESEEEQSEESEESEEEEEEEKEEESEEED
ncbi:hypothetical protein Pcinc_028958 [Petrolisthes cinctipes]|uniref:Uncharacterized protein n=1 Tax=Petrolisthes cinctipes TaxID=88211 RepID=A0AAE1F1V7_PETCI|nr:hypothetical protein Pcinc_028958 [Petrolisthes cinctipes]